MNSSNADGATHKSQAGTSDAAFLSTDNLLGSWPLNTEKMRGTYAKETEHSEFEAAMERSRLNGALRGDVLFVG